jgi:hypothetical protein
MLALPFFFAYSLVRENVDRMKKLSNAFKNGGRLQKRGDLVNSLQHYRFFLTDVQQALGWEQFLISARNKIKHAGEQVDHLQSEIFDIFTREIQENKITDILTAEKKCFALEHIKNSLLNDEFHTLAEEYLSANATAIIAEAWAQRDVQLKNLCKQKHYFDAIQDFINYATRHYRSDFFPHALLLKSIKSIIKLITGAYQQKSTFIRVCRQIQQIKKISSLLKRKKSLMIYHSHLSELFLASKPYCQIKRILKKVKSDRIESNLLGLKELLDVLESKPDDKALKGIVVSVIEVNIIDDLIFFYDNYNVRQLIPGDALFFQSIFDNLGKLLRIIEQGEETRHKKIKQKIIKFFKSKN